LPRPDLHKDLMMIFYGEPEEPEPSTVPYREERERVALLLRTSDITVCPHSVLDPPQHRALNRLIKRCPGPWASGQPLPPDANLYCALCGNEVVGYMAYKVRISPYRAWKMWDDEMGCPTFVVLRIAVLPFWRRKGAGRKMVEVGEAKYAAPNPELFPGAEPTIRTVTQVPRDCIEGRLFFGALGYGVMNGWFPGPYLMERTHTFTIRRH
jgi:hypothetical protein